MSKTFSSATKRRVLELQNNCCNNKPFYYNDTVVSCILDVDDKGNYIFDSEGYAKYFICPTWTNYDGQLSGSHSYDFDHRIEHSAGGDNSISNIQVLCVVCHRVKTKAYMAMKNTQLDLYYKHQPCGMDID